MAVWRTAHSHKKFGGARAKLDKITNFSFQAHDYIRHSIKTKESKAAEFQALYESGLSLRKIASRTGTSKTKIRKTLIASGVAIRNFSRGQTSKPDLTQVIRSGNTPYGFAYLEGKLVVDPREYQIVIEIYRLWKLGQSLRAICHYLNGHKVPTRFGKKWRHEVIKKIIERYERALEILKY
jgi:hypothetical protein